MRVAVVVPLLLAGLSACAPPWTSSPARSLVVAGAGNGDAGGQWTSHFIVRRQPWRFAFGLDCRNAQHWSFDVTLEQMFPKSYFQAVPLDLGWSEGGGPARETVFTAVRAAGEFWFIVRASPRCTWRLRAPLPASNR